jgi:hypothetical protein
MLKCLVEMKVGEAYEDGSKSDALTFGLGTDGGYVLKNNQVNLNALFKKFIIKKINFLKKKFF